MEYLSLIEFGKKSLQKNNPESAFCLEQGSDFYIQCKVFLLNRNRPKGHEMS